MSADAVSLSDCIKLLREAKACIDYHAPVSAYEARPEDALLDRIDKLLAEYDALPIIDWDSDEKPGRTGWGRARVMHYGRTDDFVFVIAEKDGKFMLGEAGEEFVPHDTLEGAKHAAAVELKRRLNDADE